MARTTSSSVSLALVTLLSVVCLAELSLEDDLSWVDTFESGDELGLVRDKRDAGKPACDKELMERLKKSCCKVPKLVSKETYKACKLQENGTAESGADSKINVTMPERFCRSECLFQNLGLLSTTGTIDNVKLATQLTLAADATWKPVIQAAITDCTTQLAALSSAKLPPSPAGVKVCNPNPAFLLSCIRRYDLLNCPTTMTTAGATCTADLATLKAHEPFMMLKKMTALG